MHLLQGACAQQQQAHCRVIDAIRYLLLRVRRFECRLARVGLAGSLEELGLSRNLLAVNMHCSLPDRLEPFRHYMHQYNTLNEPVYALSYASLCARRVGEAGSGAELDAFDRTYAAVRAEHM
jgi:hypothetical protein